MVGPLGEKILNLVNDIGLSRSQETNEAHLCTSSRMFPEVIKKAVHLHVDIQVGEPHRTKQKVCWCPGSLCLLTSI